MPGLSKLEVVQAVPTRRIAVHTITAADALPQGAALVLRDFTTPGERSCRD